MKKILNCLCAAVLCWQSADGQSAATTGTPVVKDTLPKQERYSYHFQTTLIDQYHPDFRSPYAGLNSQPSDEPARLSITSTLFVGARLWKGGEVYINPELSGGRGVGKTLGIAGFPNGETYRIGAPDPVVTLSRIFLRQTFSLGTGQDYIRGDKNILAGNAPSKRLCLTLGKYSVTDIFDANLYSHDPRMQFFNWSLMSAGAWDYPANTRGYTYGFVAELIEPGWSLKAGSTLVPEQANGPFLDMHISKAHSETIEYDRMFRLNKRPGTIRFIVYNTIAHMGNYRLALSDTAYHLDITQTRSYGRTKTGFVINGEQELSNSIGAFFRISYNDGRNETWAFTEIDQSAHAGISIKGNGWKRAGDVLGIAVVSNGISKDHRDYLAAGGYGFLIGDGKLNYGYETTFELFYSLNVFKTLYLSPDYQFTMNPAYNKDRGPISLFAIRAHIEF